MDPDETETLPPYKSAPPKKIFITIEGDIGCGKTTLAAWMHKQLSGFNAFVSVREPDGIANQEYYGNICKGIEENPELFLNGYQVNIMILDKI